MEQLVPAQTFEVLFQCLQPEAFPQSLVLAAAQCLQTLTEENAVAHEVAIANDGAILGHLLSLLQPGSGAEDTICRVSIAGKGIRLTARVD